MRSEVISTSGGGQWGQWDVIISEIDLIFYYPPDVRVEIKTPLFYSSSLSALIPNAQ